MLVDRYLCMHVCSVSVHGRQGYRERDLSNLLTVIPFPMDKNLPNFDTFATCSQSILHTLTTGISKRRWFKPKCKRQKMGPLPGICFLHFFFLFQQEENKLSIPKRRKHTHTQDKKKTCPENAFKINNILTLLTSVKSQ